MFQEEENNVMCTVEEKLFLKVDAWKRKKIYLSLQLKFRETGFKKQR